MGVPVRPGALLSSVRAGVLSPLGAARAAVEPLIPRSATDGLTLADVARRRLGHRAAAALVEPLALGVFGAPASQVGFAEALPDAVDGRSLIGALRRRHRPAGSPFLGIRGGMGRLIGALGRELAEIGVDVRTGHRVDRLARPGGSFEVRGPGGVVEADAVLLAVPAPAAAEIVGDVAPEGAQALTAIRYSASAVVVMRFAAHARRPLDAAGFLVAPGQGLATAACSFLSAKWPHFGPGAWLRAVVVDPAALAESDDALRARVVREVSAAVGLPEEPNALLLARWPDALPVFEPGHRERVANVVRALPPGVAVAGALLGAVGVPDCARSGEDAARRLVREGRAMIHRTGRG
jgi:oxygen-dependent protoporphyrinogen oxidase